MSLASSGIPLAVGRCVISVSVLQASSGIPLAVGRCVISVSVLQWYSFSCGEVCYWCLCPPVVFL